MILVYSAVLSAYVYTSVALHICCCLKCERSSHWGHLGYTDTVMWFRVRVGRTLEQTPCLKWGMENRAFTRWCVSVFSYYMSVNVLAWLVKEKNLLRRVVGHHREYPLQIHSAWYASSCSAATLHITLQVRAMSWRLLGKADMETFVSYKRASQLRRHDGVSMISWRSSPCSACSRVLGSTTGEILNRQCCGLHSCTCPPISQCF